MVPLDASDRARKYGGWIFQQRQETSELSEIFGAAREGPGNNIFAISLLCKKKIPYSMP
jgi:hypothetical protein